MLHVRMLALICTYLFLGTRIVIGGDAPSHSPDQPYRGQFGPQIQFEIDFRAIVTAPYHTKKLRVWLPSPPSDAVQQVETRDLTTFPSQVEPKLASEPRFGNRFAYFEFETPQGPRLLSIVSPRPRAE